MKKLQWFLWRFALRCLQLCLTIDCRLLFVLSIQVALLACVLIGPLAKLSFSFCKQSLLASRSSLMLSLAMWSHQRLLFGFKSPLRYLTLLWFSTKNEVMLQLTILVLLDCIMFWIEPFAYRVCLLGHVKFWIEPFAIRVSTYSIASGSE